MHPDAVAACRRGLVPALAAALLLAAACARHEAAPVAVDPLLPAAPGSNVVVVSFDALRADALGVYGSQRGATPAIDAFAADALVFRNAYTASAVTPTSFAAFFSGMLPPKVFERWTFLPPASLAERFRDAGYRTGAVINNVQLMPERGFDRGFDDYRFHSKSRDGAILRDAADWLEAHRDRQPFFLWVHFLRPHAPYRHRESARHLYAEEYAGDFAVTSGVKFDTDDPREVGRLRDLYYGEVLAADRHFSRLLEHLRRLELLERSIVVLTADHGEEFQEHGRFQHGQLYEEQLRIPLIVRHPQAAHGVATAMRARSIDLMPTLLAAVGQPVDDLPLDGVDLSTRSAADEPSPVVSVITTGKRMMSLLSGDEKLIVDCEPEEGPVRVELYDLGTDPAERHDLSRQRPERLRPLLGELRAHLGASPCRLAGRLGDAWKNQEDLDPERLEALRALGYVR